MNFAEAFAILCEGKKSITRDAWTKKGKHSCIISLDQSTHKRAALICFEDGDSGVWSPTQEDLFSQDWAEFNPPLEAIPKEFNCPRYFGAYSTDAPMHYWQEREDGFLHCSYCGSLHPDEFMRGAVSGAVITPTDKNYKAYLDYPAPGPRNVKFYYPHLTEAQMMEFVRLYNAREVALAAPGHFYVFPYFMRPLSQKS